MSIVHARSARACAHGLWLIMYSLSWLFYGLSLALNPPILIGINRLSTRRLIDLCTPHDLQHVMRHECNRRHTSTGTTGDCGEKDRGSALALTLANKVRMHACLRTESLQAPTSARVSQKAMQHERSSAAAHHLVNRKLDKGSPRHGPVRNGLLVRLYECSHPRRAATSL